MIVPTTMYPVLGTHTAFVLCGKYVQNILSTVNAATNHDEDCEVRKDKNPATLQTKIPNEPLLRAKALNSHSKRAAKYRYAVSEIAKAAK